MSVSWTVTAGGQLVAIRDYLARSSPGYALALAARIVARAQQLNANPLLGAEVPEYADPNLREVYEHPYRILYRVAGPDVQIVAVIHSSRRMPTRPPD